MRKRFRSISPNVLSVLSGVLVVLSFPPLKLGFIAYFALIPFILAFIRDDFHFGFEKGYILGVVLNFGILYWLAFNKGTEWYWAFLSMVGAVLFLALNYGVVGLVFGFVGRRFGSRIALCVLPLIWCSVEYVRSLGTLGFTWNNLCYTQVYALPLIQISDMAGSFFISFIVVLTNVVFYNVLFGKDNRGEKLLQVGAVFAVFLFLNVYGILAMDKYPLNGCSSRPARIGVVQPDIDPNEKWSAAFYEENLFTLHSLTDSVAKYGVDLVVWPETAVPSYLRINRRGELGRIRRHLSRIGSCLLTGVPDFEYKNGKYRFYNSAFFISPEQKGEIAYYRKLRLVPFGEYIPLSGLWPELRHLNLGQGNFQAGKDVTIFRTPLIKNISEARDTVLNFSVAICYESSFPDIVRKGVLRGAEMLVVITNDAWFGNTTAPYLHAEISRFRAIENRIPVVRAANTGVSMIVEPTGVVLKKLGFNRRGYITAELQQGKGDSLYAKFGDWFSILNVVIVSGLLIYAVISRVYTKREKS